MICRAIPPALATHTHTHCAIVWGHVIPLMRHCFCLYWSVSVYLELMVQQRIEVINAHVFCPFVHHSLIANFKNTAMWTTDKVSRFLIDCVQLISQPSTATNRQLDAGPKEHFTYFVCVWRQRRSRHCRNQTSFPGLWARAIAQGVRESQCVCHSHRALLCIQESEMSERAFVEGRERERVMKFYLHLMA